MNFQVNLSGHNFLCCKNFFKTNIIAIILTLFFLSSSFAQDMFDTRTDYAVGDGPHSVFSIDFNSDGYNDIATANLLPDDVSILLGNGDGTFQPAVNYAVGDDPCSVFSIDFNSDGYNDITTANGNSN
ncbi:MAG: hypothetical protein DRP35_07625, partial [Candidatus Zixiibacteriota bacterium]